MVVNNSYFYKTILCIANLKGYTMAQLATVCNTRSTTLKKRLQRKGNAGLSATCANLLRNELAPHLTLDELFPEAGIEAESRIAAVASQKASEKSLV